MADSKKFKLVYNKDGVITGSYSGIPGSEDVELIERAVLDGSKEPSPEPEPEPAEEITLEEFKAMLESLYCDEPEYILDYNKDYVCHANSSVITEMWESFDSELVVHVIEDMVNNHWFSYDGYQVIGVHEDYVYQINADLQLISVNYGTVEQVPAYSISVETDAETGDSRIIYAYWPDKDVEIRFNRHN